MEIYGKTITGLGPIKITMIGMKATPFLVTSSSNELEGGRIKITSNLQKGVHVIIFVKSYQNIRCTSTQKNRLTKCTGIKLA